MTTLKHLAVWAAVVALAWIALPEGLEALFRATDPSYGEGGADIGLGLIVFAVTGGIACVGGFVTGWMLGVGRSAVIWGVITVALSLETALALAFEEGSFDASIFWQELMWFPPFLAFLVFCPAVVFAVIAWAMKDGRRSSGLPARDMQ
jgi:hypothetical protein